MNCIRGLFNWVPRLIAGIILLQTLYFKFTAAPESVYIFTSLGIEPWGRLGTGVAELIVSILLLLPKTSWIGALGGIAIMSGAIFGHLTKLGIVVMNDDGLLFTLALVTLISCLITLYQFRRDMVASLQKILFRKAYQK